MSSPERLRARGDAGLAKYLMVDRSTVYRWRMRGWLTAAIVSHIGTVIIYDVREAERCLNYGYVAKVERSKALSKSKRQQNKTA